MYNPSHELFTNFDVTLNRIYDEEVSPLNYFNNQWQTSDEEVIFINDDLTYFLFKWRSLFFRKWANNNLKEYIYKGIIIY